MRISRFRVGTLILTAALLTFGASAQAQSLTDALIQAYRNSELLKANQALLRSVDEGVAQSRAALRPSVNLTASSTLATPPGGVGSNTLTNNVNLGLTLLLWDWGRSEDAVQVAYQNVLAARQTLIEVEQGVLLNAVIAFMDMRQNAQFLQLAENNMHVIEQQVQATKDRFDVGDVTRTTVSQAEARFAGALSEVVFRQGNLEIARETFFIFVGAYPEVLQSPPPPPRIPASLAAAKSVAMRTHPSILRAQHNLRAATLNVERAKAAMKPVFTMTGSLNSSSSAAGNTASVSVTGAVPVYLGGSLLSAYRQAVALKQQAHADVHQAGLLVSQSVSRFWATTAIARASITARQKQVRSARVALRGVREETNLGARTTLDVLDAERELVRAQSDLVSAKRDEYVAIYSLLSAMGLLTVRHLQLGIKTYDEELYFKKFQRAPVVTKRGFLLEDILKRAGK